jgi:hypothetical protein
MVTATITTSLMGLVGWQWDSLKECYASNQMMEKSISELSNELSQLRKDFIKHRKDFLEHSRIHRDENKSEDSL